MLDSEIVKSLYDSVLNGLDRERIVSEVDHEMYSCSATGWNEQFNEGIDAAERVVRTAFESVLAVLKKQDSK